MAGALKRRGFLQAILALGVAPAIVRADSLMRVIPVDTALELPYRQGELGVYQNTLFIGQDTSLAARVWSRALFQEVQRLQAARNLYSSVLLSGLIERAP